MKKWVLIVEDDVIMRDTIRDILVFEGFEVDCAQGADDAILRIRSEKFDLVITDILMPERDGYDIINEVKSEGLKTKVMAISGGGYISADAYLQMAKELGADAILCKPFDIDILLKQVEDLLLSEESSK
jgi:DNA-binding response OmpR family regulator